MLRSDMALMSPLAEEITMDIRQARKIADQVNNEQFKGFQPEIQIAFQRLHKSAEQGNAEDRWLAQILWDFTGDQDSPR